MLNRDLGLTVKHETFNLCNMGSNPIGLIYLAILYTNNVIIAKHKFNYCNNKQLSTHRRSTVFQTDDMGFEFGLPQ
jgi:hypothetical protein